MKRKVTGGVILIAGCMSILMPFLMTAGMRLWTWSATEVFDAVNDKAESSVVEAGQAEENTGYNIISGTEALLDQIVEYNAGLAGNGQEVILDAWSVLRSPSGIDDLDGGIFGYIAIPAMGVELPLYVGASVSNMAKGAAILGATSLPIGGESSNCVIAGHRGYRGIPYFREIEKLAVGDAVYITNPWETITYRVESVDIIDPYDSEAIRIQEGRDMVTLLTCHPYRSHGKYRYVVYCVRDEGNGSGVAAASVRNDAEVIIASDGSVYESSLKDIRWEKNFRIVCGGILALILLRYVFKMKQENHENM